MSNRHLRLTMCDDHGRDFHTVQELREYIESFEDCPFMYRTTLSAAVSEAGSLEKMFNFWSAHHALTEIMAFALRKDSFQRYVHILRSKTPKEVLYRVYDDTEEGELAMLSDAGAYVGVYFEWTDEPEELRVKVSPVTLDNLDSVKKDTSLSRDELVELAINEFCNNRIVKKIREGSTAE